MKTIRKNMPMQTEVGPGPWASAAMLRDLSGRYRRTGLCEGSLAFARTVRDHDGN
ncbi:hypothetical protein [Hasllibacter sp. MH4015]|uniref:hypothetical protein n=1 Tax=Hasllibacter sp. MH4015 TaxID=2854029 RepID=UPI001CD32A4A|nr:hypothetical protein [Hasllibacter sp. MH4015]